jgi:hypothetical protein
MEESVKSAPSRDGLWRWAAGREAALLALVAFAVVLWPRGVLNDGDTWWHLSAGDWILAHQAVPHADPFSYTFAGQPWVAHEWLSEVLLSLSYSGAGWRGVMLLTAAACGLATWLLARAAGRSLHGLPLWLTLLAGLALFAPHLLARPHILVLPVMVVWVAGLVAARRERRRPSWGLLAAMVLWANMHGSFLAGIAVIVPFALEAALEDRRALPGWLLFMAASVVAALCTPFGPDGLLQPIRLLAMHNVQGIGEWSPLPFDTVQPLHVVVLAFAAFWLLRRPKLGWIRWLLLLGLLALSVRTQRHEMLLGLLGILLLAEPITAAVGRAAAGPVPRRAGWALLAPAVLLATLRLALPIEAPVTARDPAAAIAAIPPALRAQHVLNAYEFGGYLIRSGIAPFIDSRAELYGDAFLDRYNALLAGRPADVAATLAQYDIGWTMLSPGTPLAASMAAMPGWHRLYADAVAVIDVRETGAPL